jgi:hypothetical protein
MKGGMDLRRTTPLIAAIAIGCGALAGCGNENDAPGGANIMAPEQISSGGGGANELAASDAATVLGVYRTIGRACSGDAQARQELPRAVQTLDQEVERYPNKVWEVGSADRARVMYDLADEMAQVLDGCGLQGGDVLRRRAELGRQVAEDN